MGPDDKLSQKLFELFFGSNGKDGKVALNSTERSIAELFYTLASKGVRETQKDTDGDDPDDEHGDDPDDEPGDDPEDEAGGVMFDDDDDSLLRFSETIVAAVENCDRVVELFKLLSKAKEAFLKNFDRWSSLRKRNVQRLKEIADEIHSDKFNSDIAKVVGGSIGITGGILFALSFIPPLTPVAAPLAISAGVASTVGSGVAAGSTGTEMILLRNKLEEAQTLVKQEMENFSTMNQWFIHTEEFEKSMKSLIDCDLLKEMSDDWKRFRREAGDYVDFLKDGFREELQEWIGKMSKNSKIVETYGVVIAPVVMTFVFVVCLMRDHNRITFNCIIQISRFTMSLIVAMGIGFHTCRIAAGLAAGCKAPFISGKEMSIFVAANAAIDIMNVVQSSIDIHHRTEPEHTKKIKKAAEELEKEFHCIARVYDELKKWKSIDWTDVTEWKTFIISLVPHDAEQVDIKMAVKPHVSEEAWDCIKLERNPSEENIWLVKLPASHSQMILRQSHLIIKRRMCQVMQLTQWKTFIITLVPHDAEPADIKMAVKPYLSKEARGFIMLERDPRDRSSWIVKIPASHSQTLLKQSHLMIKNENCQVMQLNQWKTFIAQHIPDKAGQEDIKIALGPHLPEEARGLIKLQKLSTGGNNWLVKVPIRYSQNLMQQSHIIVKGERCLITQ